MGKKVYKDIEIGDIFGRWTVIKKGEKRKNYGRYIQYWVCCCSCDEHTIREVNENILKNKQSKSCGCIRVKNEKKERITRKDSMDITGEKFNHLTSIKLTGYTASNPRRPLWLFECDCGNQVILRKDRVTSGHTKSCGCLKTNDLSGKKFGKLNVINIDLLRTKTYNRTIYECLCDCGNITYVNGNSLICGNTQSCGCISKEVEDLVGKKFDELTVVKYIGKRTYENNRASVNLWECKCSCGNTFIATQHSLKSGFSRSCGCLKKSKGENFISITLKNWGVNFVEQYRFQDCKYKISLPFDFAIIDENKHVKFLCEFDGEFHDHPVRVGNMTYDEALLNYLKYKIRDDIKDSYCKNNNIPLIRIHYDELYDGDLVYTLFDSLVKYGVITEQLIIAS